MNPEFPPFDSQYSTADIFDSAPELVRQCDLPWRHFGGRQRFAGTCSTVLVHDFPQSVVNAVAEPGRDRILIIDGRTIPDCACLGDILAARAVSNGWSGVIVAGAIRDSAGIGALPLGVLALRTTAKRPFVTSLGDARDGPIELGGVVIQPGDTVYVDEDAVIVVPLGAIR